MAAFIPSELKRFRTSIVAGTISIFLIVAVFTFIGGSLRHGFVDTLLNWRNLLHTYLFLSAPLSLFSSLMLSLFNPVAFSNEGIYGYSVNGKKILLLWEGILQVRKFTLLNLTWLRIYSKADKNVLWLPLFQARPAEFLHEIGKLAPADSPIRNFLKPKNA